jgi:hypothetical protein
MGAENAQTFIDRWLAPDVGAADHGSRPLGRGRCRGFVQIGSGPSGGSMDSGLGMGRPRGSSLGRFLSEGRLAVRGPAKNRYPMDRTVPMRVGSEGRRRGLSAGNGLAGSGLAGLDGFNRL